MSIAVTDALAFTVEEQTGDKRKLTLTERALPYRPIEFSGEQGAEFTKYPGNPIRTLQIFGDEELPTEVNGYWKDRFLGAAPDQPNQRAIAYVTTNGQQTLLQTTVDLCNAVVDIRRKGQVVVVQWGPRVRRGLLKRFTERWHNVHDVEWTMRFEWQSQNDPEVPAVVAKDTDYANAIGAMLAKLDDLSNLVQEAVNDNIVANTVFQYSQFLDTLQGTVSEFSDTVTSTLDTQMPVLDQQKRLAGILNDVANDAQQWSDAILAQPAQTIAVASFPGQNLDGPILAAEATNREIVSDLRDMRYLALGVQNDILKSINPDILAAYTARQSTDLRDVSTFYYDVPDEWRSLMIFNALTDSRLSAGQTVFVPKLIRPLDGSE